MTRIRIVLADDHALVLEGLRALLDAEEDLEVVATAADGDQLLSAIGRHAPDVVVLDLELGATSGIACLERIRRQHASLRVLVLTAYADGATMRAALEGGADGYALKTESPRQAIAAIRQVHAGQLVFPAVARRWLLQRGATAGMGTLTEREREVLARLADGASNADIAASLHMSRNTVKFHLQHIYAKLGVGNRTEAVALFLKARPHPR